MNVIISWLESLVQSVLSCIKFVFWLLGGLVNLGTVMTESINIFAEILEFLPGIVTSTMIAVCGGLIVFRIFGRS